MKGSCNSLMLSYYHWAFVICRVGLSAGTGMGLSSAMLNYQNAPPTDPVVNNNNVQGNAANQNEEDEIPANQNNNMAEAQEEENNEMETQNIDQNDELPNSNQEGRLYVEEAMNNDRTIKKENESSQEVNGKNLSGNVDSDVDHKGSEEIEVDSFSIGMETVILYPGKDHKEKEKAYKGLIITESPNLDQETPELHQIKTDITNKETDQSNCVESENPSKETSNLLVSETKEHKETDSSNDKNRTLVECKQKTENVSSRQAKDSCEDVKVEQDLNSHEVSEESGNTERESTRQFSLSIPRMRPTRSCVKGGMSKRKSDDSKTSLQNKSKMSVNQRNKKVKLDSPERSLMKRSIDDKNEICSNAKIRKKDCSQCLMCSCKVNERLHFPRKRSRNEKNKRKRKLKCKCMCHAEKQSEKLNDDCNKDCDRMATGSRERCGAEESQAQGLAEMFQIKKELIEETVEKVDKACEAKPEDIRQTLQRADNFKTREGKSRDIFCLSKCIVVSLCLLVQSRQFSLY